MEFRDVESDRLRIEESWKPEVPAEESIVQAISAHEQEHLMHGNLRLLWDQLPESRGSTPEPL
jgi:hypothetical protein